MKTPTEINRFRYATRGKADYERRRDAHWAAGLGCNGQPRKTSAPPRICPRDVEKPKKRLVPKWSRKIDTYLDRAGLTFVQYVDRLNGVARPTVRIEPHEETAHTLSP